MWSCQQNILANFKNDLKFSGFSPLFRLKEENNIKCNLRIMYAVIFDLVIVIKEFLEECIFYMTILHDIKSSMPHIFKNFIYRLCRII